MRNGWLGVVVFGFLGIAPAHGQILPAPEPRVVVEASPPEVPSFSISAEPTVPCEPSCACRPRTWVRGETLLWWYKDMPVSTPLATTAPGNAPVTINGLFGGSLGRPDTTVVLGGENVALPLQFGGRISLGTWFDNDEIFGVEGSFTFLPRQSKTQAVASGGDFGLFNPFFNTDPSFFQEDANVLALPGVGPGAAALTLTTQMYMGELNGLWRLSAGPRGSLHLVGGFRYVNVNESMQLTTTQISVAPAGQFLNTLDQFKTNNNFYGGQIGLRLDKESNRFFVQATAKVAYGVMNERVSTNGQTFGNSGPNFATIIPLTTVPGGIYTQPTNIGTQNSNRGAFIPEATVNVGVKLGGWGRAFVGYNFLYISQLARAGNQADHFVNGTQLTSLTGIPTGPLAGAAAPAAQFRQSDFWAQGINLGFELKF